MEAEAEVEVEDEVEVVVEVDDEEEEGQQVVTNLTHASFRIALHSHNSLFCLYALVPSAAFASAFLHLQLLFFAVAAFLFAAALKSKSRMKNTHKK